MGVALPHAGIAIDAEDIAEEKVSMMQYLTRLLYIPSHNNTFFSQQANAEDVNLIIDI